MNSGTAVNASLKLWIVSASRAIDPDATITRGERADAAAPHHAREENTMKGVVFLGDRKLELRDFPDPTPGPRDVVLEIKASGMCGSDLHNYRAPAQPAGTVAGGIARKSGVIAGHEPCGVVAAVGSLVGQIARIKGCRAIDIAGASGSAAMSRRSSVSTPASTIASRHCRSG